MRKSKCGIETVQFPGGVRALAVAGAFAGMACITTAPVQAITVTLDTNAPSLAAALTAGTTGLTVTGATLTAPASSTDLASTGTFANPSGTYGIGPGIVLSTGNAADYGDGLNQDSGRETNYAAAASVAQEALLDPISGGALDHFDSTQLDIAFNSTTGAVAMTVVFGSEEFPEFIGRAGFGDVFGIYLNGVNIAQVGGAVITVNHPDMMAIAGTELDGILAPGNKTLVSFSGPANPTGNTISFILADTGDDRYDSTVYLSSLTGTSPVPVPPAAWLLGSGLLGLVGIARRRASTTVG